jgi:hypothetical protein
MSCSSLTSAPSLAAVVASTAAVAAAAGVARDPGLMAHPHHPHLLAKGFKSEVPYVVNHASSQISSGSLRT